DHDHRVADLQRRGAIGRRVAGRVEHGAQELDEPRDGVDDDARGHAVPASGEQHAPSVAQTAKSPQGTRSASATTGCTMRPAWTLSPARRAAASAIARVHAY